MKTNHIKIESNKKDSRLVTEAVALMNRHGLTDKQALDVALERESLLDEIETLRGALTAIANECGLSSGVSIDGYFIYFKPDGNAATFPVDSNGKRTRR